MKTLLIATVLAAIVTTAAAEQFDQTILLRHEDWTVEHSFDASDGQQWCAAGTEETGGTAMGVIAFDDGMFAFTLHNQRWNMPEDAERYITVDVDDERFDGWASTSGSMLFLTLDGDVGVDFLKMLRDGDAVAVYNDDMRRISTFSLRGSAAAVAMLGECFSRIRLPDEHDPFGSTDARSSDPFL